MPKLTYAAAKGRAEYGGGGGFRNAHHAANYAAYMVRLGAAKDSGDFSSFRKDQYMYIDTGELNRSIEHLIRKLRRIEGFYMSNEAIKEIFMKNAEGYRAAIANEAPIKKGAYPKPKAKVNAITGRKSRKRTRQPGQLKNSITVFPSRSEDDTTVYIGPRRKGAKHGDKKADGFYGYFLNYGTSRGVAKRLFIQKAFVKVNSRIVEQIRRDIGDRVNKADRELNGAGT